MSLRDPASLVTGALVTLVGGLILMIPSFLNGSPFIFADTASHLAYGQLLWSSDPANTIVTLQNDPALAHRILTEQDKQQLLQHAASHLGVRSVLYSVLLDRSIAWGSMWGALFLQTLFASAAMRIALNVAFGRSAMNLRFLVLCFVLTATPANIALNLLLPDALTAGMILLIVAAMAGWSRLTLLQRAWCLTGVVIALTCHLSHIPIAILTAAGAGTALALAARKTAVIGRPALALIAALLSSLALTSGLNRAAEARLGMPIYRPPLLMGRVIDDGPGRNYLANKCETSTYRICEFKDRILSENQPTPAGNNMLFLRDPAKGGVYFTESDEVRADLRNQELAFVRDAILAAPVMQVSGSIHNILRLLGRFNINGLLSDVSFSYDQLAGDDNWIGSLNLFRALPNRTACEQHHSEKCGSLDTTFVSAVNRVTVAISVLILIGFAYGAHRKGRLFRATGAGFFFSLVMFGVLTNTLACGILAGGFDRYQWRVIWLVPMAAASLVLWWRRKQPNDAAAP